MIVVIIHSTRAGGGGSVFFFSFQISDLGHKMYDEHVLCDREEHVGSQLDL